MSIASKDYRQIEFQQYNNTILKIGIMDINCSFVSNKKEDSNILGMNAISQLNQLFNFQDTTVMLSKNKITKNIKSSSYKYYYYLAKNGTMVISTCFNDSIPPKIIFDTGWILNKKQLNQKNTELRRFHNRNSPRRSIQHSRQNEKYRRTQLCKYIFKTEEKLWHIQP